MLGVAGAQRPGSSETAGTQPWSAALTGAPGSRCSACVLRAGVQAPCVFITPPCPVVRGGVVTPAVPFSVVFTEPFNEEGF